MVEADITGRVDPQQLLDALSPLLKMNGGITGVDEATRIVRMMQSADKLVSRCIYCQVLKSTKDKEILHEFVEAGGWEVMNDWLNKAKAEENSTFLFELLSTFQHLPVTIEILKKGNCAKTIKQLSKTDNKKLQSLAGDIVDNWMAKVRGKSAPSDKNKKKHKKRKEDHNENKHSADSKLKRERPNSPMDVDQNSNDSNTSSNTTEESNSGSQSKPRPKTVKVVPTKTRFTGLEQEPSGPPVKRKDKTPSKRASGTAVKPPPEKKVKSSPHISIPTPAPPPQPKPRPPQHEVHLSSGFMDAIENSVTIPPIIRRRRRSQPPSSSNKPSTPTSPQDKPTLVPSFYQETLETEEDENKPSQAEPKKEGSPEKEASPEGEGSPPCETKEEPEDKEVSNKSSKNKRVTWADDANLSKVFYFILDDTERINVNRIKEFGDIKKAEMMFEREHFKKAAADRGGAQMEWKRPPLISGLTVLLTDRGCNSIEKEIQKERENGVLLAIYFTKEMIPDSPMEPETEQFEPEQPKVIPLEDETGSSEAVVKDYPAAAAAPTPEAMMNQFSLPPDVASMVADMAKQVASVSSTPATPAVSMQTPLLATPMLPANSVGPNVAKPVPANQPKLPPNLPTEMQAMLTQFMAQGGNIKEEDMKQLQQIMEPYQNQLAADAGGQGQITGAPPMVPHPGAPGMRPGPGYQQQYPPMMGPMRGHPPGMRFPPGVRGGPPPPVMRGRPPPPGPHRQGPPPRMPPRGPMPPRMMRPRGRDTSRIMCTHFMAPGGCRNGNSCRFLHPGVNGPPS